MPQILSPNPAPPADGYYGKREKVEPDGGLVNFEISADFDNDGVVDEGALQVAFNDTDSFVDLVMADEGVAPASDTHYVATTHRHFGAVSDAASERVRAKVYRMRGVTADGNTGPEGQMSEKLKRAEENIRLAARVIYREQVAAATDTTGIDGISVIGASTCCRPFGGIW
jgi:hypothetical protein